MHIMRGDVAIDISGKDCELAVKSEQFQNWFQELPSFFAVRSIEFQSVDIIHEQVRFIKFKADVADSEGKPLPGIVFMRGGSVAILVVLECEGEEYTVLTLQPRFAVGDPALPEIPAGTMEDNGDFKGAALRELEEETGLKVSQEDLIDLMSIYYYKSFPNTGVYVTPGGSDEYVKLFALRKKVTKEELGELEGKCTGLAAENEQITLSVIKLEVLPYKTVDAKALSAYLLYLFKENRILGSKQE
jgi:ADP-sugar diphosphatase